MIHVIPGPRESLDIEAETVTLDGTAVYQVRQGSSEITAMHEQLPELWVVLFDLWDAEMRRRQEAVE